MTCQSQSAALTGYTPPLSACERARETTNTQMRGGYGCNLAEDHDIGPDAIMVARKQPPSPCDPGLDFVTDEEHVVLRGARGDEGGLKRTAAQSACTFLHSAAAVER